MAATKSTRKRVSSELANDLQGFVTMANSERLSNELATKLGVPANKAKSTVTGMIRRLAHGQGILASRSKNTMNQILDEIQRLRPAIQPMVEELRGKITYKSGKTGKRENSWIRDLLAGVPRLHSDNNFYAYVQIDAAKAKAICDELGVEVPTEAVD